MKILVGLGNPGDKYQQNRHNVGALLTDFILKNDDGSIWKMDKYLHGFIVELKWLQDDWIFLKPQTYMNLSGKSVKAALDRCKIQIDDLIVAHDDLDIPLGKFKIQKANGPKLHNGLTSIEQILHSNNFWRIRIGVENRNPTQRIPGETYVLQNFAPEEMTILEGTFEKIGEQLKTVLKNA